MDFRDFALLKKFYAPYKAKIIVISILALIGAMFEAINLGALVPLLQLINSPNEPGGTLWSLLKTGFSFLHIELNFQNLLIVMAVLFLIGQCIIYLKKRVQTQIWFRFSSDLKNTLFKDLLSADITYHYNQKSGQFIDLITRESEYAATSVFVVTEILTYLFFIGIYCIMLLYISIEMTILCLLISLGCFYLLNILIRRSKKLGEKTVGISLRLTEFINERLNLLKLIKIFSNEPTERERLRSLTDEYIDNNTGFVMNGVKIETVFQVIIFGLAITILYIAAIYLHLSLPLLLVFIFILIRLTDPLRQLNTRRHELAGELASLEKIDAILSETASAQNIKSGKTAFKGIENQLCFENVTFGYKADEPVVKDLSFCIRKNEMVALVGASGGGKSTIVDLLIRLIEPQNGTISIDGRDLKDFDLSSYHHKIGFVSQDSYLLNDTVLANICYGSDLNNYNEAIEAAKFAHAHEFITGFEKGYDTVIGDKGVKLSGGQKQRISLARALYKKPELLILDEATSALDSESERIIQQSIAAIKNRFTLIVIAHRISTIENADTIFVVEKGVIIEQGSHAELIHNEGIYARYYQLQHAGNSTNS
ncbi:MAG: Molybdate/tungstate import ATP-binding protein WtpC [Methanoregula sp. PtaU1.Bin051]|nr:MAG: Molybdate/tungstate import ATP-binding protein WtpC [Methanoregula sp. PtaU1.Bin051]